MTELHFRQSNLGPYQIVSVGSKKYIMDLSTMVGKLYFWGFLKDTITVDMIEIDKNNRSFEIKSKMQIGFTTMIALMVQPLVKVIYDVFQESFIHYNLSQQIFIKILFFIISIALGYIGFYFYLKKMRTIALSRLSLNTQKVKIYFKSDGKRNLLWYTIAFFNLLCFAFYIGVQNGTEGTFLVINGLISFLVFLASFGMPAIGQSYKVGQLIFEKIEEI